LDIIREYREQHEGVNPTVTEFMKLYEQEPDPAPQLLKEEYEENFPGFDNEDEFDTEDSDSDDMEYAMYRVE
jgi:hypothetical protein